jgi:flagellar hook capping protein FlgD/fibronectin type III domain protein
LPRTLALAAAFLFVVVSGPGVSHAASGGAVTLQWTAPGDDGLAGTAKQYQLRYSPQPITQTNFMACYAVPNVPAPEAAGTLQSCSITGLTPGQTYYFAIRTWDEANNVSAISNVVVKAASGTVGLSEEVVTLAFSQPYPNPSRQSATFAMGLPQEGEVLVEAFDVQGRQVRTLASGRRAAGQFHLVWDLRDDRGIALGAGVYIVRAVMGGTSFTRRVIVSH